MIVAVADTHTVVWYLFSDRRLGAAASAFIDAAASKGEKIGVSAISIAETIYLVEKKRIPESTVRDLRQVAADPRAVLRFIDFGEPIAMQMTDIAREDVPDLPDRIVAATASYYRVPLLTCDRQLQRLPLQTIW